MVGNPSFEDQTFSPLSEPDSMGVDEAQSGVKTVNAHTGKASYLVKGNGNTSRQGDWGASIGQLLHLTPSQNYVFSAWAKCTSASVCNLSFYLKNDFVTNFPIGTKYKEYSAEHASASNSRAMLGVSIRCHSQGDDTKLATIWYDDVSVTAK